MNLLIAVVGAPLGTSMLVFTAVIGGLFIVYKIGSESCASDSIRQVLCSPPKPNPQRIEYPNSLFAPDGPAPDCLDGVIGLKVDSFFAERTAMLSKDVMTTQVISVLPDTTVREIAKLLLKRGISAVPVLDADGKLLGIDRWNTSSREQPDSVFTDDAGLHGRGLKSST